MSYLTPPSGRVDINYCLPTSSFDNATRALLSECWPTLEQRIGEPMGDWDYITLAAETICRAVKDLLTPHYELETQRWLLDPDNLCFHALRLPVLTREQIDKLKASQRHRTIYYSIVRSRAGISEHGRKGNAQ